MSLLNQILALYDMWFAGNTFVLSGIFIFTALHGMQTCRRGLAMRILSVRPSVCPSVTRENCDKR